mgnify:CR=1 FL=1
MVTFGTVHIEHPTLEHVKASLRASYNADPASHGGTYLTTATLTVETGAARIQVYATAETLRAMAALLTKAADAVDEGVFAAAAAGKIPEAA